MNSLPWQDQIYIALAAFAVVGAVAWFIWVSIGTIEDVPQPGGSPLPGPGPSLWAEPSEEDTLTWLARVQEDVPRPGAGRLQAEPAGPGHSDRLDELAAAFTADTLIDKRMRDWLDELIEKGLDGYRTADEWVAARTRELAAVST